jgi:hypothetical protein
MIATPGIGAFKAAAITSASIVGLVSAGSAGLGGRLAEGTDGKVEDGVLGGLVIGAFALIPTTGASLAPAVRVAIIQSPRMRTGAIAAGALGGVATAAAAYFLHFKNSDKHPHTAVNVAATGVLAAVGGTAALWLAAHGAFRVETAAVRPQVPEMRAAVEEMNATLDRPVPARLVKNHTVTRQMLTDVVPFIDKARPGTPEFIEKIKSRVTVLKTLAYHDLPETVPADLQPLRDEIETDIAATIQKGAGYGTYLDNSEAAAIQSKIDLLKLELAEREAA